MDSEDLECSVCFGETDKLLENYKSKIFKALQVKQRL